MARPRRVAYPPSPNASGEGDHAQAGQHKGSGRTGTGQAVSNFFLRDFLHSEIAAFHGLRNIPDDPDLAIAAGRRLCEELLEPLQATFGRLAIRSAYRSPEVNDFGNRNGLNCASNTANAAAISGT